MSADTITCTGKKREREGKFHSTYRSSSERTAAQPPAILGFTPLVTSQPHSDSDVYHSSTPAWPLSSRVRIRRWEPTRRASGQMRYRRVGTSMTELTASVAKASAAAHSRELLVPAAP